MSDGLNSLNQWLQDTIFKPLEDKKMPVMEHLVELQVRLTRTVIITALVFVGTFFYADTSGPLASHPSPEYVCAWFPVVDADRSADRSVRLSRAG